MTPELSRKCDVALCMKLADTEEKLVRTTIEINKLQESMGKWKGQIKTWESCDHRWKFWANTLYGHVYECEHCKVQISFN